MVIVLLSSPRPGIPESNPILTHQTIRDNSDCGTIHQYWQSRCQSHCCHQPDRFKRRHERTGRLQSCRGRSRSAAPLAVPRMSPDGSASKHSSNGPASRSFTWMERRNSTVQMLSRDRTTPPSNSCDPEMPRMSMARRSACLRDPTKPQFRTSRTSTPGSG